MRLRNDDDVHRYQSIFVDVRGWNVSSIVRARYVTWFVWAVTTAVIFAGFTARVFGAASGFLWAAAAAAGVAAVLAPHLSNEVSLTAWVRALHDEGRAWRATRRAPEPVRRWTPTKESN